MHSVMRLYLLRLLRVVSSRRSMAIKKQAATSSHTALELRRQADEDRRREQTKRAERRELERRAAREDIDAQRLLLDAKSAASAERRKEIEASRLARLEEDRRKAKVARATEDARWLQVTYPLELANRLIAWRRGLPDADVASIKARIAFLVRFGRTSHTISVPHFWTEDKRFTSHLGNVLGVDKVRHSVRSSKDFEWLLFNNSFALGNPNDATYMLQRLLGRICPDGHLLFRTRYTSAILLHDNQYVVEKAFVQGVFLLNKWLGAGWLPDGAFVWPPPLLA